MKTIVACIIALASVAAHAEARHLEVLVQDKPGHSVWLKAPEGAKTDTLGRIAEVDIDGKKLNVLATRHSDGKNVVVVDRISYEGDESLSNGPIIKLAKK